MCDTAHAAPRAVDEQAGGPASAEAGATASAASETSAAPAPRAKRVGLRLAALFLSSLLALFALEGVVRVVARQKLVVVRPDIWMPDDGLGYRHRPNLNTTVNTGERTVRLVTDAQGHRAPPEPSPEPARTVLALGDSFVAAMQVEYADALTGRLERMLGARLGEPVRIVNAGVSGWNPSHYLIEARREFARRSYDLAIVCLYMPNDVMAERYDHMPAYTISRHHFRLPRTFTAAEWIDAVAYPINDTLEERSHLFNLFKNRGEVVLMRLGLTARYFPDVLRRSYAADPAWGVTADVVADIVAEAEAHGARSLVVLLPGQWQIDADMLRRYMIGFQVPEAEVDMDQPPLLLTRALQERGIEPVDTTPVLRDAFAAGKRDLYGDVDYHFSPFGHEVTADFLAPVVFDALTAARPVAAEAAGNA